MPLIAKATGGGENFEPVEAGNHTAICVSIYDLGTQHNKAFDKDEHKILIGWELPDVVIEIEREGEKITVPRMISAEYTLSLHEKARLRLNLEGWRGRKFTEEELGGFELKKLLGKSCTLNVVHNPGKEGKVFANIAGISPIMRFPQKDAAGKSIMKDGKPVMVAVAVPAPINPLIEYCIEDHGKIIPDQAPEWIAKKIKESREYKAPVQHDTPELSTVGDVPKDDIPF